MQSSRWSNDPSRQDSADTDGPGAGVQVLVPLKSPERAKTRLLGAADDGRRNPAAHTTLVLAMAADTLGAAMRAPNVDRVFLLCPDRGATALLLRWLPGVDALEVPGTALNADLRTAERRLPEGSRRAVLHADLPALRPEALAAALRQAGRRRAYCPDHAGSGSTLLIAASDGSLDPHFGTASAAAHERSGARKLDGQHLETLRQDVDVAEDLDRAMSYGLGTHTASVLAGGQLFDNFITLPTTPQCQGQSPL